MAETQIPPQSIPDEEVVLSEVLDHKLALKAVIAVGLEPDDFYMRRHAHIFRAMRHAAGEGRHPDEPTTWEALRSLGLALEGEGSADEEGVRRQELGNLTGKSVNPNRVRQTAERLIEKSLLRKKLEGAQQIQAAVYEPEESKRETLMQDGLERLVSNLRASKDPSSAQEVADEYLRYLKSPAPAEFLELPFSDLNDCILGGLVREEVSVLGAWPEHGKSWLVDQILKGFSDQGYRSVLFATEMSWKLRTTRFVSTQTAIPMERLLKKEVSEEEMAKTEAAVRKLPYDQHNAAGWSENEICERIILGNYDVAVVDVVTYLPEFVEKVQYAERICQRFLATAQRANCHVLLVSHFNRERDKDGKKPRPAKRDLKHTTALEQIAGSILFLHRDESDQGDVEPGGELFWAKTRTGMTGSIRVVQNSRFLTFQKEAGADPPTPEHGVFVRDDPPDPEDLF